MYPCEKHTPAGAGQTRSREPWTGISGSASLRDLQILVMAGLATGMMATHAELE